MSETKQTEIIPCKRCGARCRIAGPGRPDARMLKLSQTDKGLCVNCATHDFLRNTYPVNMIIAEKGPGILAHAHIRLAFGELMRVGKADAQPEEINWNLINENWELPFPTKVKRRATNPCCQAELDEITEFARKSAFFPEDIRVKINKGPLVITRFAELDLIEPGLGEKMRELLQAQTRKMPTTP